MFKYGVISGPYFHVFSPNTGKYRPEITPYLDTFHAVVVLAFISGVELFNNGGKSARTRLGGKSQMGDMASRWGKSNPQDAMIRLTQTYSNNLSAVATH